MLLRTKILVAALGLAVAAPSLPTASIAAIDPGVAPTLSKAVETANGMDGTQIIAKFSLKRPKFLRPKLPRPKFPRKKVLQYQRETR